jgi:hypothetical protein
MPGRLPGASSSAIWLRPLAKPDSDSVDAISRGIFGKTAGQVRAVSYGLA